MHTNIDNFKEAVAAVGGQVALAKLLTEASGERVTQQRVWSWIDRGNVPAVWIPYISCVTGMAASSINPAFALIEKTTLEQDAGRL